MKRLGLWLVVVLVTASLIGCGGSGGKPPAPPSPSAAAAAAKAALLGVAESGQIGSGMMSVTDYIDSLKATDAKKAEELSKEMQQLGKLSATPDALKAKAKEIADKL